MADPVFSVTVENADLLAALRGVGVEAEAPLKAVAQVTATRVANEARGRLGRATTKGYSTGETSRGITVEISRDGRGFVVVARNERMPNLPLWLERGTERGKPGSHGAPGIFFFDSAAKLEEGPHRNRVRAVLADVIATQGFKS